MIMIVIAWQRPEVLGLGMGIRAIDKVYWMIYIDGYAQGDVMDLGGGLVHNIIIGYVH